MADSHKIKILKNLIGEYYSLENGALIDKPSELLRVVDIKSKNNEKHPHKDMRVYISRKAIKHFVEERKAQLSKSHTPVEVLTKITFAAEQISEVIINFNKYEFEPPESHFYIKHYQGEPSIRILCEVKNESLEICSIHFRKKEKQKTPS